tara:strand:+ start:223 stop:498 length:276 start_codon:yes stop_codon:yes gene_type:complete
MNHIILSNEITELIKFIYTESGVNMFSYPDGTFKMLNSMDSKTGYCCSNFGSIIKPSTNYSKYTKNNEYLFYDEDSSISLGEALFYVITHH